MSFYISSLNAAVKADRERQAEKVEARHVEEMKAARERLMPLRDRLARLLATIPEEVRQEGLSMSSLQTSLRGRWRGAAAAGEVGTALRKLGWERTRSWRAGGSGFAALWYPPNR